MVALLQLWHETAKAGADMSNSPSTGRQTNSHPVQRSSTERQPSRFEKSESPWKLRKNPWFVHMFSRSSCLLNYLNSQLSVRFDKFWASDSSGESPGMTSDVRQAGVIALANSPVRYHKISYDPAVAQVSKMFQRWSGNIWNILENFGWMFQASPMNKDENYESVGCKPSQETSQDVPSFSPKHIFTACKKQRPRCYDVTMPMSFPVTLHILYISFHSTQTESLDASMQTRPQKPLWYYRYIYIHPRPSKVQ